MTESFPLFPLHSVLLPGAAIQLRIFERRYLDLVRDCGRSGTGFGVCMILDGHEAGEPATPAAFGVEAVIEDFDAGADGLLHLRLRGRRRFRVERTRVRDNGLIVGDVQWCEPDSDDEIRPEHSLLATVLEKMIEHIDQQAPGLAPSQFDNAAWVSWRLAELLPISESERLALLQLDDAHARLDRLIGLIE